MSVNGNLSNWHDSFICERLTDNDYNSALITKFKSERGNGLVDYLNKLGQAEDRSGVTAFYIVKDGDDNPILFFSLKCGTLFCPFDKERIDECFSVCEDLSILTGLNLDQLFQSDIETIFSILKNKNNSGQTLSRQNVLNFIFYAQNKEYIKTHIFKAVTKVQDTKQEEGRFISRVHKTYPGIELVHFCADDVARQKWRSLNLNYSLGEYLFWNYVVNVIEEVQRLVGCEYIFLFAADSSEDNTLINYYEVSLNFKKDNTIGTVKPLYDFSCIFMSQKISDLKENRDKFFDRISSPVIDDAV